MRKATRRHRDRPGRPALPVEPSRGGRPYGADIRRQRLVGGTAWLDEAAAELLLTGARPAPPDGRAVMAAARLARLLAAASAPAGRPRVDPAREAAALAAFRAAAPAEGPRNAVRVRGRALRVSAAAVGAVLAVGSVAVTVAGGRYAVPGDGAGSGPLSRPPAVASAGTSAAGKSAAGPYGSAPPHGTVPSGAAPSGAPASGAPTHEAGAPAGTAGPAAGRGAYRDRSRGTCRKAAAHRPHCGKRHEKGHTRTHKGRRAGDTSVG